MQHKSERVNFGSKLGAILAAAGSAVGLGNIWRFPYETGNHGGAAFILIYLGCVIVFGLPIMIAEFTIGRRAKACTGGAYETLAPGTLCRSINRLFDIRILFGSSRMDLGVCMAGCFIRIVGKNFWRICIHVPGFLSATVPTASVVVCVYVCYPFRYCERSKRRDREVF